jgi:MCP family monocarboxylic acid transporter-like MFS transporter 14
MKDAGFLLSIVGISNTLSRVVLGYISDKPWVNRLYLYNIALTICGLGKPSPSIKHKNL